MSELDDAFAKAQEDVKTLTQRPSNDDFLALYANFKQANKGDVTGSRPGRLAMVDRAKYDAWASVKGASADTAKQTYIDTVTRLLAAEGK